MKRLLQFLSVFATGVLLGTLTVYLPGLNTTPPATPFARIQVANGEGWAKAWDVANGEIIEHARQPESWKPVAVKLFHQSEIVGYVFTDGTALVIRRDPDQPWKNQLILTMPKSQR